MKGFPRTPRTRDDHPLVLNKAEKRHLGELDSQMSEIQRKKVLYLRERARKKGLTAPTLGELKSESGEPFVAEKSESSWGHDYKRAVVKEDSRIDGFPRLIIEQAYLCQNMFSQKDSDGCGWVKGTPVAKPYDDIGILSGSAGTQYFCKICGKMIGEHATIMS